MYSLQLIKDKLNEYVINEALGFKYWGTFIEIDEFYNIHVHDKTFYIWDRKLGKDIHMENINDFLSK